MKKTLLFTMIALLGCFGSFATLTGPSNGCLGGTIYYADTAGGTYTSSNPGVATIDAATGVAYGVSLGTTVISYTLSGTVSTVSLTINPNPSVTPTSVTVCAGASASLSASMSGGTWSSYDNYVAGVTPAGVVYGSHGGTTLIEYMLPTGCAAYDTVTVTGVNIDSLIAPLFVCLGSSVVAVDSTLGGTWSTSNSAIATVSATGDVYGVAVGTVIISYTVPGALGCGSATATASIDVISSPTAGTIGTTTVHVGFSAGLTATIPGGNWSASPASVATIDAVTGIIYGVSAGTAAVTYTVSSCGGTASAYAFVSVDPTDYISGTVNFATPVSSVKVWLIDYTAPILTAVDSTIVYGGGTSLSYSFNNVPTGNYRVKAGLDTVLAGTGYIPTYHTNSFYWNTATVVSHTFGTTDVNVDITMAYGATTAGPGFIGGDVTTGANKGTSTSIPAVGMLMYLFNTTSTQPIQAIRTDAAGHYSFSNLPVGATYYVFPDELNYATTPYAGIALTAASPSQSAASFKQHTLSKTITPIPAGISVLSADASSVMAFPNPTSGKVSITWQLPAEQDAAVTVCDITGREVYKTNIDMTVGAGISQLNLSTLNNGLYTISVKSAALNYNSKLQIQH